MQAPRQPFSNIFFPFRNSIPTKKNPAFDFVEPVLARHTENKFSSVLAYSRLSQKNQFINQNENQNDNQNDNLNDNSYFQQRFFGFRKTGCALMIIDFCHDSAITKQALMALTAPKIENLGNF